MKKIIKVRTLTKLVEVDVDCFEANDGKVFDKKEDALTHERLIENYSKLSKYDIEWVELFKYNDYYEEFMKAMDSEKVILLIEHSGGEEQKFEIVEPILAAVEAVIKVIHRKSVGMNYNSYVIGVIYKNESLDFKDIEGFGDFDFDSGFRNIKDVLV